MPNRPKPPQEIATTLTYSARPDYHIFLALVHQEAEGKEGRVNISMGIRHLVEQMTQANPHYAELFQEAGKIHEELSEMEGYLEQKPAVRAKLQEHLGKRKNYLLEWRLQKPEEFQAWLTELKADI